MGAGFQPAAALLPGDPRHEETGRRARTRFRGAFTSVGWLAGSSFTDADLEGLWRHFYGRA